MREYCRFSSVCIPIVKETTKLPLGKKMKLTRNGFHNGFQLERSELLQTRRKKKNRAVYIVTVKPISFFATLGKNRPDSTNNYDYEINVPRTGISICFSCGRVIQLGYLFYFIVGNLTTVFVTVRAILVMRTL